MLLQRWHPIPFLPSINRNETGYNYSAYGHRLDSASNLRGHAFSGPARSPDDQRRIPGAGYWVIYIERNAIAMISDPNVMTDSLQATLDCLLGFSIAFKGYVAQRSWFDRVFILIGLLEQGQRAAIVKLEKGMTTLPAG
jgi:hypothetical protein